MDKCYLKSHQWLLTLALTLNISCGTKKSVEENAKDPNPTDQSLGSEQALSSPENREDIISSSIAEAFELIADFDHSSQDQGLRLNAAVDFNRTCEEQSDHTLVTVDNTIENNSSWAGPFADWTFHSSGRDQTHRKWSQNGSPLRCLEAFQVVQLPESIEGLTLEIDFTRTLDTSTTRTVRTTGKKSVSETAYKANGHRVIRGFSQENDGDSLIRSWSILSKVDRCLSARKLALTVETKEDVPLDVDVKRSLTDGSLLSKTLKQGTLIVTKNPQDVECVKTTPTSEETETEEVAISFSNFSVTFDQDGYCHAESGSFLMEFHKNGTAEGIYEVATNESGELTAVDKNTNETYENMQVPLCGIFKQ